MLPRTMSGERNGAMKQASIGAITTSPWPGTKINPTPMARKKALSIVFNLLDATNAVIVQASVARIDP
jgi:hypothetical protein